MDSTRRSLHFTLQSPSPFQHDYSTAYAAAAKSVLLCIDMPKEKDFERFTRLVLDQFKRMDERFDTIDDRFDGVETRLDSIDANFDKIEDRLTSIAHELADIRKRLETLEEAANNLSGFAKEIDHLLRRVAAIEKHLGLQTSIRA